MKKDLNYYLGLEYNYIVKQVTDKSGTYFLGRVMELEGCQSDGETIGEVYANLKEVLALYIETKLEGGFKIQEPVSPDDFSGKFNVKN